VRFSALDTLGLYSCLAIAQDDSVCHLGIWSIDLLKFKEANYGNEFEIDKMVEKLIRYRNFFQNDGEKCMCF